MDHIKYSKNHLWIKEENNDVSVGLTDYAINKLENILFLNLPDCGELVTKGSKLGDVESVKTVSDLISPITGKILSVNDLLVEEPDNIKGEKSDSWLIKMEAVEFDLDLMTENQYKEYTEKL